jgi:hypothetical protein
VHRLRRSLRTVLVASAGVATALGVASLTQSASGQGGTQPPTATETVPATTETSSTSTTTTPKAKRKATKKTVSCKAKQYATRPPVTTALEFATLTCASPLGRGVQQNSAAVTRNAEATQGSFRGTVKLFFDTGTLRGTYTSAFTVQNAVATFKGTLKISSGTGTFKGVTGTGTITGTSSTGLKSTLTEKLTLTLPPARD